MTMFIVGERLPGWDQLGPQITQDGAQFVVGAGGYHLLLCLTRPSEREVTAVRRHPARFALVVRQPVIWLLYRFGSALRWNDAPYTIHRVPPEERVVPELEQTGETRAFLQVTLVDRASGRVLALRPLSLSAAFTRSLHAAVREQAATPYEPRAYEAAIAAAYRRWHTPADMLAVALAETEGGA